MTDDTKGVPAEPSVNLAIGWKWELFDGRWRAVEDVPRIPSYPRDLVVVDGGSVRTSGDVPASVVLAVIAANSPSSLAAMLRAALRSMTIAECARFALDLDDGEMHGALVRDALGNAEHRYYITGEGWVDSARIVELALEIGPPPESLAAAVAAPLAPTNAERIASMLGHVVFQHGGSADVAAAVQQWCRETLPGTSIAYDGAAAVAGMAVPRDRTKAPEQWTCHRDPMHGCWYVLETNIRNTEDDARSDAHAIVDRILASGFPALVAERDRLAAELANERRVTDAACEATDEATEERDRHYADLASAVARAERAEREWDALTRYIDHAFGEGAADGITTPVPAPTEEPSDAG